MSKSSSSSITDVLDSVIGINPANSNVNNDNGLSLFVPSAKFNGSKPNYVFRNGDRGVGYYLDHPHNTHRNNDDGEPPDQKRPRIDNNDTVAVRSVRFDPTKDETQSIPPRKIRLTGEQLLAQAEELQHSTNNNSNNKQILLLDVSSPKSIAAHATSLRKLSDKNSLLRAQYIDDPAKFMMNEVSLHDTIVSFKNAAVDLSSYHHIVKEGVVTNLVKLMMHENSDVGMCVVSVLVELLDGSLLDDDNNDNNSSEQQQRDKEEKRQTRIQNMGLLAHAFIDEGGFEALSNNLGRYDETIEEDARGVEDALTLIESLLDLDRLGVLSSSQNNNEDNDNDEEDSSSVVIDSICKTLLPSWLFRRIEIKNNNSNNNNDDNSNNDSASNPISPAVIRLHVSEVLSTILQHEDYSMKRRC
eukprot:scaffold184705_cov24-Cyclotella_meneghiniana.AAC.1